MSNEGPGAKMTDEWKPASELSLVAILNQNWENARHIKNERMWFTNIYALVVGTTLSLMHGTANDFVFEIALIAFIGALSVFGLVTSLRLKAELEHCLRQIDSILEQIRLPKYMNTRRNSQDISRIVAIRWLFPTFYATTSVASVVLLALRIATGR
ncbi:MAG: hypothetical protein FJ312_10215 [SAR202 cluster bacterium]|nr:hypothetical protein [SAR202 cluster bacterium]